MFFFVCSATLFYLQRSSFLFAAFLFLHLQRFPFLFAALLFCLQRFFFVCSVPFLFAAFLFCLQRFFFVCSVSFLFAAFLFYLQRFFLVCSVSLVGHRRVELCPTFQNKIGGTLYKPPYHTCYDHFPNAVICEYWILIFTRISGNEIGRFRIPLRP